MRAVTDKPETIAGHRDQFPTVGSYILFDRVPRMPVVIVRTETGFNAFFDTCSHRGGRLVTERAGQCPGKRLMCGYHAWTYDLAGNLIGVPDSRDFNDLDNSKRGLMRLKCETWGGWIFVNADPEAAPLADYLGTLTERMAEFDPENLALIARDGRRLRRAYVLLRQELRQRHEPRAGLLFRPRRGADGDSAAPGFVTMREASVRGPPVPLGHRISIDGAISLPPIDPRITPSSRHCRS